MISEALAVTFQCQINVVASYRLFDNVILINHLNYWAIYIRVDNEYGEQWLLENRYSTLKEAANGLLELQLTGEDLTDIKKLTQAVNREGRAIILAIKGLQEKVMKGIKEAD